MPKHKERKDKHPAEPALPVSPPRTKHRDLPLLQVDREEKLYYEKVGYELQALHQLIPGPYVIMTGDDNPTNLFMMQEKIKEAFNDDLVAFIPGEDAEPVSYTNGFEMVKKAVRLYADNVRINGIITDIEMPIPGGVKEGMFESTLAAIQTIIPTFTEADFRSYIGGGGCLHGAEAVAIIRHLAHARGIEQPIVHAVTELDMETRGDNSLISPRNFLNCKLDLSVLHRNYLPADARNQVLFQAFLPKRPDVHQLKDSFVNQVVHPYSLPNKPVAILIVVETISEAKSIPSMLERVFSDNTFQLQLQNINFPETYRKSQSPHVSPRQDEVHKKVRFYSHNIHSPVTPDFSDFLKSTAFPMVGPIQAATTEIPPLFRTYNLIVIGSSVSPEVANEYPHPCVHLQPDESLATLSAKIVHEVMTTQLTQQPQFENTIRRHIATPRPHDPAVVSGRKTLFTSAESGPLKERKVPQPVKKPKPPLPPRPK